MNLKYKLLPTLIAVALGGCGSGSPPQSGETVTHAAGMSSAVACIDLNHNLQCDDGDTNVAGERIATLTPQAGQRVLLEQRNEANLRTRLLLSAQGSNQATALATLRAMRAAAGSTIVALDQLQGTLIKKHGDQLESLLASGFAAASTRHAVMLEAMAAYAKAVATQGTAQPVLPDATLHFGNISTDASWVSEEKATTQRQLSVRGSTVLNNSESNRLYLFDAASDNVNAREIDLLPPPAPALASAAPWLRRTVALLDRATSLAVDTVSAATGFPGTPGPGAPVALPPGKGVAAVQLVDGGNSAFVVLNMLAGGFTEGECRTASEGHEGLFKVSLNDASAYRWLKQVPACIHSGFSLLASDAAGARVAAWDAKSEKLWLLDGASLARFATIDLHFDATTPPQALALTPGGQYLAVAASGRLTLVDMTNGKLITQLRGNWGEVAQVAFAAGGRRILLASGTQVFRIALDDGMQLQTMDSVNVPGSDNALRGLAVAADGDSYVVTSDNASWWLPVAGDTPLTQTVLPPGLRVQQTALAGNRLIVLARGAQDRQFKLMRIGLPLPTLPDATLKP